MIVKEMLTEMNKAFVIFGDEFLNIEILNLCNRPSGQNAVLSYVTSDKYVDIIKSAKHIKGLMCKESDALMYQDIIKERNGCILYSDHPEYDFYGIHEWLCRNTDFYDMHNFSTKIGSNCNIHSTAKIETKGVLIGDNVKIGADSVVKKGSIIDNNTVIGCNSVIGSEGFQLVTEPGKAPMHITHVGKCHICSDVYIGDNTCVCNSLFEGETYIGTGTKIDNFVQVAHNIYIGENVVITAGCILCGSLVLEDEVWIGPNASVLNKVIVGKGAKVGLGAVVIRDVAPYTTVVGNPAKALKIRS